jgi:radical SAM protein with 4Fe4S-binding SPASM domain
LAAFEELNYHSHAKEQIRPCELLRGKMYVLYNGDVVLCCMDWRRQVVMGNVGEDSLEHIWKGPRYRRYREMHMKNRAAELPLCGVCSYVRR